MPFPLAQELLRTLAPSSQAKVEYRFSARLAVLPQVRLMIRSAFVVHLHRHDRFVGLQIGSAQQILPHRRHHRLQQLAHAHHPTIQRGPADLQTRFPLQDRRLPVQRQMIAYFATTVSITTRSLANPFSTMRGASGGIVTVPAWQQRQARFSRLITRTK